MLCVVFVLNVAQVEFCLTDRIVTLSVAPSSSVVERLALYRQKLSPLRDVKKHGGEVNDLLAGNNVTSEQ